MRLERMAASGAGGTGLVRTVGAVGRGLDRLPSGGRNEGTGLDRAIAEGVELERWGAALGERAGGIGLGRTESALGDAACGCEASEGTSGSAPLGGCGLGRTGMTLGGGAGGIGLGAGWRT
jgi:hypothetical protein